MKRTVYLGIGDGGLWLALIGEPIPPGATVLDAKDGKFWLRQSVPPMAHPNILHAISDIAESAGYPFHGAAAFADMPFVMDTLAEAIDQKRLVAYRAINLEGGGKGPAPQPQPGPKPPAPAPTPVNPLIDPPVVVVVVQKKAKNPKTNAEEAYTHPKRQSFTLKTDAAFDGTATFTCDKADKVKFFSAAKDGTEIKFDGTANVFKPKAAPAWAPKGSTISSGVTVFVEAVKPSDKKEDITVKLALSGGSKPTGPDDTSKITSVEVTLDIHKSSPDAASAPALSKDDKVFVGRNLVVQDKVTKHYHRAKLVITDFKPSDYEGDVVLKSKDGHLDAFKEQDATKPAQATALPFKIKGNKAKGTILWAEGLSASDKVAGSGFNVGLPGIEDIADLVTVTAVEIKLDICQSRTTAQAGKTPPADPSPMSDADKVKVGRFVHEQDAGNHHGRALLIVRKVKPEKFQGTLRLEAIAGGFTELYDKEVAASGGALVASPKDFDLSAEKNEDKKLWVQGKAGSVSAKLRDSGYLLHLKDDPIKNADTVVVTVCRFSHLKADFPATAAQTERTIGGVANANRPARHSHEITGAAKEHFDFDDATNKAVVLIEDSILAATPVKLSVQVLPAGVPVLWDTPRDKRPANKGDHKDIAKLSGNPTITPVAAKPLEATLVADAVGTFHVAAFIDNNGSKKLEPLADLEPYLCMNLVLVRVEGVKNRSVRGTNAVPNPAAPTAATGCRVVSGLWTAAGAAAYSKATVKVTGGGNDGRRGLDRISAGWCQHIGATGTSASVPPGLDIFARYQFNPPPPPPPAVGPPPPAPPPVFHRAFFIFTMSGTNGTRFQPPPAVAPVVAPVPVLDVSPGAPSVGGVIPVTSVDGIGGNSCTGQAGAHGPFTALTKAGANPTIVDKTLGQEWTVDTLDSPSVGLGAAHAGGLPGRMIAFRFGIDFRADLVFWTNITGVATPTATDPANRLYSSVQTNNWTVRFSIAFNPPLPAGAPPYAGPPAGAPGNPTGPVPAVTLTMTKDPNPKRRATPVEGSGLETRYPSGLALLCLDATA